MLTLSQLASVVAKIEGKKKQARIGDIREIFKIMSELEADGDIKVSEIFQAEALKLKLKKERKNV